PFRVLLAPLVPGGARGFVYLTLHLAAWFAFAYGILYLHAAVTDNALNFIAGLCAYLFIYLGLGSVVSRLARRISGDFRPAHARVTTILMIALGSILPQPLYFFDTFRVQQNPPFWITDPFSTLNRLSTGDSYSGVLMVLLALGVVFTLLVNLYGMLSGIIDVARRPVPNPPSRPRPVSATHAQRS